MLRLTLGFAFAVALASPAVAEGGDATRGFGLANSVCSKCHAIAGGPERSPDPMAPRFSSVADTPGMTETALRAWLFTSHPTMPNIVLNRDDTDNVVAYILSLKH